MVNYPLIVSGMQYPAANLGLWSISIKVHKVVCAMKIRLYRKEDASQLAKLLAEFLKYTQQTYSQETRTFSKTIKCLERGYVQHYVKRFTGLKRSRFLVVEEKGVLVAYILGYIQMNRWEKDRLRGYIESVFVSEKYRGKGWGKKLYVELVGWFKKQGCRQLILVVAQGNPSIHIYKKWGFVKTRQEMRKTL